MDVNITNVDEGLNVIKESKRPDLDGTPRGGEN
jgi:hypothetical protein